MKPTPVSIDRIEQLLQQLVDIFTPNETGNNDNNRRWDFIQ